MERQSSGGTQDTSQEASQDASLKKPAPKIKKKYVRKKHNPRSSQTTVNETPKHSTVSTDTDDTPKSFLPELAVTSGDSEERPFLSRAKEGSLNRATSGLRAPPHEFSSEENSGREENYVWRPPAPPSVEVANSPVKTVIGKQASIVGNDNLGVDAEFAKVSFTRHWDEDEDEFCGEEVELLKEERENKCMSTRDFSKRQYTDIPEIPIRRLPRSASRCLSLLSFCIAIFFPIVLLTLAIHSLAKSQDVEFGPEDRMMLDVEFCDVLFEKDSSLSSSRSVASFRIFWFFGQGSWTVDSDGSGAKVIKLQLHSRKQQSFFSCYVKLQVGLASSQNLKSLEVKVVGEHRTVVEISGAFPTLVVAQNASFTFKEVRATLRGLDIGGHAAFVVQKGALFLDQPRVQQRLQIEAEQGAALQLLTSDNATVVMPSSAVNNSIICGANISTSGLQVVIHGEGFGPLHVAAGGRRLTEFDAQHCQGQRRHSLSFDANVNETSQHRLLSELHTFLDEKHYGPAIASVQLSCPTCSDGVWQFFNSKAFVTLNLPWFALLTGGLILPCGLLPPDIFETYFYVLGQVEPSESPYPDGKDLFSELKLLHSDLDYLFDRWEICWRGSDVHGTKRMYAETSPGSKYKKLRTLSGSDAGLLIAAFVSNIVAACILTYLGLHLFLTVICPGIAMRLKAARIEEAATHRLSLTKRAAQWWVFACRVEYPSCGAMLRWRRCREHALGVGYFIQVQSVADESLLKDVQVELHQDSVYVPKSRVKVSQNNPHLDEYLVQSTAAGGRLRLDDSYKFQVRVVDQQGKPQLPISAWSAVVQITPPTPLMDMPMLLLKTIVPEGMISPLRIFSEQMDIKDLEVRIQLSCVKLGFRSVEYEELLAETGARGCVLDVEWNSGQEAIDKEMWQESADGPNLSAVKIGEQFTLPGDPSGEADQHVWFQTGSVKITQTSTGQDDIRVRLRTCCSLREVFRTIVQVKDLHSQWERQGEQAVYEHDAEFYAKTHPFYRDLDGFRISFCVVFEDNDPFAPTVFKPMWCPLTPYGPQSWKKGRVTQRASAGFRHSGMMGRTFTGGSDAWVPTPFRSIMPSEMIMQGTRKVVTWDKTALRKALHIAPQSSGFFRLEVRAGRGHSQKVQRHLGDFDVDRGQMMWSIAIDPTMEGRFVLVATGLHTPHHVSPASVEFFVDTPLTLQEFELAYASFCRSYELAMDFNFESLEDIGINKATVQLSVCSDLRPVFPVEKYVGGVPTGLEVCKFKNAITVSTGPIRLLDDEDGNHDEGQRGMMFRSSVELVEVVEGASWNIEKSKEWPYKALIFYDLDLSYWLVERMSGLENVRHRKPAWHHVQRAVYHVQEGVVYLLQFSIFSFLPVLALAVMVMHGYLSDEFYSRVSRHMFTDIAIHHSLADWFASPSFKSFGDQALSAQLIFLTFLCYLFALCCSLVFFNFFRDVRQLSFLYRPMNLCWKRLTLVIVACACTVATMCIMWVLLSCLVLAPEKMLPLAVMIASLFLTTGSFSKQLASLAEEVRGFMLEQVDVMLNDCVTEFMDSRPELKNCPVSADLLFYGNTWQWDKHAESFCQALCELSQVVEPIIVDGQEVYQDEEKKHVQEELDSMVQAGNADFGLSPSTRRKIDICFDYMVNKTPLPAGIEQSLHDVRKLAELAFHHRDDGLERILRRGRDLCKEIALSNIARDLNAGLISVLRAGADSKINVLDVGMISRDSVGFYDKTLMELIRTHIRSTCNQKFEDLLDRAKQRLPPIVGMNDEADDSEGGIDVTTMRDIQLNLLPRLQTLGVLAPSDLCNLQKDCSVAAPRCLKELYGEAMHVTRGKPKMTREHLVQLLNRMFDKMDDGNLDQVWHSAYRDYLEELYLTAERKEITLAPGDVVKVKWQIGYDGEGRLDVKAWNVVPKPGSDLVKVGWTIEAIKLQGGVGPAKTFTGPDLQTFGDEPLPLCTLIALEEVVLTLPTTERELDKWGRPVTARAAEKAWQEETGDQLTMDLDRIEDVILARLTMWNGSRKLWPEAFILMARYLHLWPEIPFEDVCVEIVGGSSVSEGPFHFGAAEYGPSKKPTKLALMSEKGTVKYYSTVFLPTSDKTMKDALRSISVDSIQTASTGQLLFAYSACRYYGEEADSNDDLRSICTRRTNSEKWFRGEFNSLGSFAPSEGFAFLQTSWNDLSADSSRAWLSLIWDQDAQASPKSPPFEGPLEVFLIFLNVDPELSDVEVHGTRRWILKEGWKPHENMDAPSLKKGEKKWRGFDAPDWSFDKPDLLPKYEVWSKVFPINYDGENTLDLKGFGEDIDDNLPILIFVRTRRTQAPDPNSFKDAHEAPFKRSSFFFREIWTPMDIKECKAETESKGGQKKPIRNTWFVDLAPDGNEMLRQLVMDDQLNGRHRELQESGDLTKLGEGFWIESRRVGNSLWYQEGGSSWSRLRGLWFDAFLELLVGVGLDMDRQSAWSLWRRFTSTKEEPKAGFGNAWHRTTSSKECEPGGIAPVRNEDADVVGVVTALEELITEKPFLSDSTFKIFNHRSGLQFDDRIAEVLYLRFCDQTPNYEGAKNLISWTDFARMLSDHILRQTHHVEMQLQGDQKPTRFRVGGIWFEPLYHVVITCMPEVPTWSEVHELYNSYCSQSTGLCPIANIYDVIAKLGRPGLKFEQFTSFISRLGMKISSPITQKCFQQIDVDQNHVLGRDETTSALNLLFNDMLPELILTSVGLGPVQILKSVLWSVVIMVLMYIFLGLSFLALGSVSDSSTVLQSALAAGLGVGYRRRKGSGYASKHKLLEVVKHLEEIVGRAGGRHLKVETKDNSAAEADED